MEWETDPRRLELDALLQTTSETENVYFQPPASARMKYPAVTYKMDSADTQFADNIPYIYRKRYAITVIDRNPDSKIPDKIAHLPMCVFDRAYQADGLNHWIFIMYY